MNGGVSTGTINFEGIAQGGNTVVAIGQNISAGCQVYVFNCPGAIFYSNDGAGKVWTPVSSSFPQQFNAITYTGAEFIAVGSAGAIYTSPDGKTWTNKSITSTNNFTGVTYLSSGPMQGQTVIVGSGGTVILSL